MDQVHGPQGGPWPGSTGVVHGPGSMFCICPLSGARLADMQIRGICLSFWKTQVRVTFETVQAFLSRVN